MIIHEHDYFQHTLKQARINPGLHALIKHIDDWEQESITKIQQKAKESPQELHQLTTIHCDELSKKLRYLTNKIVDDLKEDFDSSKTFSINRYDEKPLVPDISINFIQTNELFEQVFDDRIRIKGDGLVAIHDESRSCAEVRGQKAYIRGRHEICLYIEQSAGNWIFLGINLKLNPLQKDSYYSKLAYGWTNNNHFWLKGRSYVHTLIDPIEMKTNDIVGLIFACDQCEITIINQRTYTAYALEVNIDYCPFPWQLHINLVEENSCVRIVSD